MGSYTKIRGSVIFTAAAPANVNLFSITTQGDKILAVLYKKLYRRILCTLYQI